MRKLTRRALLEVTVATAYQVVCDVVSYPQFVPACDSVTVLEQLEDGLRAKVVVAARGMRQSFTTVNHHVRNERIKMMLEDGPFERLVGEWQFAGIGDAGCRVSLAMDFVPKGMLAMMLSGVAEPVADTLVDAFCERMRSIG